MPRKTDPPGSIRVAVFRVGGDQAVEEIPNTLEGMQQAAVFRIIADLTSEIMPFDFDPIVCDGPLFGAMYAALNSFAEAVAAYRPTWEKFVVEHGALVEEHVKQAHTKLFKWAPEICERFSARASDWQRELVEGIESSKDELDALSREWSGVDGDGIDVPV